MRPGSHYLPNIYIIIQLQCTCIALPQLLTNSTVETALSIRVEYLCTVPFDFGFINSAHFQSYLGQNHCTHLLQWCVIQLGFLVTSAFLPGIPCSPKWFYCSSFVLWHYMGFDKFITPCLYHYCIRQNSFTDLKSTLCLTTLPVWLIFLLSLFFCFF